MSKYSIFVTFVMFSVLVAAVVFMCTLIPASSRASVNYGKWVGTALSAGEPVENTAALGGPKSE